MLLKFGIGIESSENEINESKPMDSVSEYCFVWLFENVPQEFLPRDSVTAALNGSRLMWEGAAG